MAGTGRLSLSSPDKSAAKAPETREGPRGFWSSADPWPLASGRLCQVFSFPEAGAPDVVIDVLANDIEGLVSRCLVSRSCYNFLYRFKGAPAAPARRGPSPRRDREPKTLSAGEWKRGTRRARPLGPGPATIGRLCAWSVIPAESSSVCPGLL